MPTIRAVRIDGRIYRLQTRGDHPFADTIGGIVVTDILVAATEGCQPTLEVRFDDNSKITTALSNATVFWTSEPAKKARKKAKAPGRKRAKTPGGL